MNSLRKLSGTTLRRGGIVAAVLVVTTADAHAYVDPGTGAMIVQIIGALVAGALFYFRAIRDKIASWYSRLTSRSPAHKDQQG
ncbi:MAG TPA: hypothetical protein VIV63_10455 [Steroidobacteraceae bacterium]